MPPASAEPLLGGCIRRPSISTSHARPEKETLSKVAVSHELRTLALQARPSEGDSSRKYHPQQRPGVIMFLLLMIEYYNSTTPYARNGVLVSEIVVVAPDKSI